MCIYNKMRYVKVVCVSITAIRKTINDLLIIYNYLQCNAELNQDIDMAVDITIKDFFSSIKIKL